MAKKNQVPEQSPRERIHRGWMLLLLLLGVVLTAAAFPSNMLWGWLDADSTTVVQSILVSFGVALISAGVLFIFEPKLRKAVRKTTESAVQNATETIREDIEDFRREIKEDVDAKIQSFEDRMNSAISNEISQENSDLDHLAAEFSYANARRIMELAYESNAISSAQILVDATDNPSSLRVGLSLQFNYSSNGGWGFATPTTEEMDLYLNAALPSDFSTYTEMWHPDEDFSEPVNRLLKQLERLGLWGRLKPVDWKGVHERLSEALDLAIKSRRQDPEVYPVNTPLLDVVGTKQLWFISGDSIECPSLGWKISIEDFRALAGAADSDRFFEIPASADRRVIAHLQDRLQ